MWELWEAPGGRRHLVIGGKARCVQWWPNRGWRRVESGYISCARCARSYGWGYVTASGVLLKRAGEEPADGA